MQNLLLASFAIPLHQDGSWQTFKFSKIPSNQVTYSKEKLSVAVNKSASPLIYSFGKVRKINSVQAKIKIIGPQIPIKKDKLQGDPGFDDFSFRLGLVKKGSKTLNWMEKQIAPQWVLKMYELAPQGMGIENIHFLVATQEKKLLGKTRTHPLSEYFTEEFTQKVLPGNTILFEKTFSQPLETVALWISADGDDTSTKYDLEISQLKFNYK